jgi:hypothetical protein
LGVDIIVVKTNYLSHIIFAPDEAYETVFHIIIIFDLITNTKKKYQKWRKLVSVF